MNIYEKLNKIQTELKAPKGQMNKFGGYKYRSCEDILESVKPLLDKYKAVLVISDELIQVGERYYIMATATLYDTESEGKVLNQALAREEEVKKGMDSSQITGAASSYARKYALNGLLAIDDTKDSDATNDHGKDTQADMPEEEKIDTNKKIGKAHIEYLTKAIDATKTDFSQFLAYMDIERIEDMTIEQFTNKAKPALDKKAKAKK